MIVAIVTLSCRLRVSHLRTGEVGGERAGGNHIGCSIHTLIGAYQGCPGEDEYGIHGHDSFIIRLFSLLAVSGLTGEVWECGRVDQDHTYAGGVYGRP